jgi:hypothetical protein
VAKLSALFRNCNFILSLALVLGLAPVDLKHGAPAPAFVVMFYLLESRRALIYI